MTIDAGSTPPTEPPVPGSGGAATPDRTQRIDALADYFRANRAAFTMEALRKAAADSGYEPRDIDAAWAVAAIPAPSRGAASAGPVLVTILYVVGTYGLAWILLVVPETTNLALPFMGVALIVGILGWLTLRDSRPALASAFKFGVIIAIVLPLVIALVALGLCFVLVAGMGGR